MSIKCDFIFLLNGHVRAKKPEGQILFRDCDFFGQPVNYTGQK